MKSKTNICPFCNGEKDIRAERCKDCHMKKMTSNRGEEWRKKISETRKKLFVEKKLTTWNKGLTKEDPRVLKNITGGSQKTQFKPGPRPHTKGNKNNNWKGGSFIHQGYVLLRVPDHPLAVNGYVMEHRLIMERHINRYLTKMEVVHHKNRIPSDNRIENLILFKNSGEHMKFHGIERRANKKLIKTNSLLFLSYKHD